MEALNKILMKAREQNMFQGLCVGNETFKEEATHLFFVDDVLLFCEPDMKA